MPLCQGGLGIVPELVHPDDTILGFALVLRVIHVVRVGDAVVGVEAVRCREHLRMVAEVPFAETGRGVAPLPQVVGDSVFVRVKAGIRSGEKYAPVHPHPFRVATGKKCCPRGTADGRGGHEAGEFAPLSSESVEMGRANRGRAEGPEIAVAHVICEDEYKVGFLGGEGR